MVPVVETCAVPRFCSTVSTVKKIPRYSVVPWVYFNFNDTILCLIIVILNTSSGIKYVLSPIVDVTTTFGSIHLA